MIAWSIARRDPRLLRRSVFPSTSGDVWSFWNQIESLIISAASVAGRWKNWKENKNG